MPVKGSTSTCASEIRGWERGRKLPALWRSCKARRTPVAWGVGEWGWSVCVRFSEKHLASSVRDSFPGPYHSDCLLQGKDRSIPTGCSDMHPFKHLSLQKVPRVSLNLGWRFDILATSWFGHFSSTTSLAKWPKAISRLNRKMLVQMLGILLS